MAKKKPGPARKKRKAQIITLVPEALGLDQDQLRELEQAFNTAVTTVLGKGAVDMVVAQIGAPIGGQPPK